MINLECNSLIQELNENEKLEVNGGIVPAIMLGVAVLAITAGWVIAN